MNTKELDAKYIAHTYGRFPLEIVSGKGSLVPGLEISVIEAPGVKCPRCWKHSELADGETGLCPRCREVLKSL